MRCMAVACVLASLSAMGCAAVSEGVEVREARPVPWPPQSLADHWTVGRDGHGRLTAACDWQYGVVDRRLTIAVQEGAFAPASGTIRYPNGHVGTMSPEELGYFWEFGGAQNAVERQRPKGR
jgi:hypothetical protein